MRLQAVQGRSRNGLPPQAGAAGVVLGGGRGGGRGGGAGSCATRAEHGQPQPPPMAGGPPDASRNTANQNRVGGGLVAVAAAEARNTEGVPQQSNLSQNARPAADQVQSRDMSLNRSFVNTNRSTVLFQSWLASPKLPLPAVLVYHPAH